MSAPSSMVAEMARPSEHRPASRPLEEGEAEELAASISLFGTASRQRLLWAMIEGERSVEDLAEAAGLSESAASHQLRLLREGRVVAVRRVGRHAFYRLYDHHVPELLAAMRHHHEHAQLAAAAEQPPSAVAAAAR